MNSKQVQISGKQKRIVPKSQILEFYENTNGKWVFLLQNHLNQLKNGMGKVIECLKHEIAKISQKKQFKLGKREWENCKEPKRVAKSRMENEWLLKKERKPARKVSKQANRTENGIVGNY